MKTKKRKKGRQRGSSYEVQVIGIISNIIKCLRHPNISVPLEVSFNMPSKDLFKIFLRQDLLKIFLRLTSKLKIKSRTTLCNYIASFFYNLK